MQGGTKRPQVSYTSTPSNLLHFNKVEHKADHKKSHSVLLSNRLTKSYFSLHDTSLNNRGTIDKQQLRNAVKSIKTKIKGANSKFLDRYHSQLDEASAEYHNITQASIPKISLKKNNAGPQVEIKRTKSTYLPRNNSNKFKLLFRDSTARKTISQRKIDRLDRKISDLELHNKYLTSLKPEPPNPIVEEKVKPRGTVVDLERIKKLVRTLVRNISLYFSMYVHPKKVGDLLKSVEGYNEFFHRILFENTHEAKKITNEQDILKYFWIFKDSSQRPEYYGEEDLYLFNILQNYSLKMQRSYMDIKKNFIQFERIKLEKLKKDIGKKLQINQKKLPFMALKANPYIDKKAIQTSIDIDANIELEKIAELVDNRKRHNQDRREASLAKLESLGVRFNIQERSKQLIVREKEKLMKNCVVKDRKGPIN